MKEYSFVRTIQKVSQTIKNCLLKNSLQSCDMSQWKKALFPYVSLLIMTLLFLDSDYLILTV